MKHLPHKFNRRVLSWLYCSLCGLVLLRNPATEAAVRRSCPWGDE